MFNTFLAVVLSVLFPKLTSSVEPKTVVLEEEVRNGYVCRLIEYNVSKEERVKAYLLVPDGASKTDKRPGIVMLHDHGARFDIGKEKLVRPINSAPEYIKRSSQQWISDNFDGVYFADAMVEKGYVVLVSDMLYWGERSSALCRKWSRMKFGGEDATDIASVKTAVYEGQRTVYDSLAKRGIVWAWQTLEEDAAAARFLSGLEYVDKHSIGTFGWSMGAHRAWLLAAFCKEVKTGVALCWMTLKSSCLPPYKASDYSMLIPSLREKYDFYDIARPLSPKPFFFLSGKKDKLFPVSSVAESFRRMQEIYSASGAPNSLRTEFFDGPHHCGNEVQSLILEYFEEQIPIFRY